MRRYDTGETGFTSNCQIYSDHSVTSDMLCPCRRAGTTWTVMSTILAQSRAMRWFLQKVPKEVLETKMLDAVSDPSRWTKRSSSLKKRQPESREQHLTEVGGKGEYGNGNGTEGGWMKFDIICTRDRMTADVTC